MSAYPNPTDAVNITRARLMSHLDTIEGALADIRRNLDGGSVYYAATDADELVRVAKCAKAAASDLLQRTSWPGKLPPAEWEVTR